MTILQYPCPTCEQPLHRLRTLESGALWACAEGHYWIHLIRAFDEDDVWIPAPALVAP